MLFDGQDLREVIARTTNAIELRNEHGRCRRLIWSDEASVLDLDLFIGIGNHRRIRFLRPRTQKHTINSGSRTTQRVKNDAGANIAHPLMEVLHDWTDQQSQQILRQIRTAAPDLAKLLVVETMLPDESAWTADKGRHFGNDLDINMLVLTGGRERTSDEFAHLFVESGWRLSRVIPTDRAAPWSNRFPKRLPKRSPERSISIGNSAVPTRPHAVDLPSVNKRCREKFWLPDMDSNLH
jgi:hypothetical protein